MCCLLLSSLRCVCVCDRDWGHILELGDRPPGVPGLTPPLTDRQLFGAPAFYYCDKMPEKNNLKSRFILTHGGRGFQSMASWLHAP